MPRFHVRDAFAINDKTAFVMAGFVVEGDVVPGMLVRIPFHATTMLTAEIDHIQTLRRPDGDVVCLCIKCADPREVTLWDALKLKDHNIEVIPAA
jgi:hypothetical protein